MADPTLFPDAPYDGQIWPDGGTRQWKFIASLNIWDYIAVSDTVLDESQQAQLSAEESATQASASAATAVAARDTTLTARDETIAARDVATAAAATTVGVNEAAAIAQAALPAIQSASTVASDAATVAVAARDAAVVYRDYTQSASAFAMDARDQANTVLTTVTALESSASTARDTAVTSATAAQTSATAAQTSAASAQTSATTASDASAVALEVAPYVSDDPPPDNLAAGREWVRPATGSRYIKIGNAWVETTAAYYFVSEEMITSAAQVAADAAAVTAARAQVDSDIATAQAQIAASVATVAGDRTSVEATAAEVMALYPQVRRAGSVAELRGMVPPGAGERRAVFLESYWGDGDTSAASMLVWIPASTRADNGVTVFAPTSAPANGRWERDTAQTPVQWGGASLARTPAENQVSIQNMIDVIYSEKGAGQIFFDQVFPVAGRIYHWPRVWLVGSAAGYESLYVDNAARPVGGGLMLADGANQDLLVSRCRLWNDAGTLRDLVHDTPNSDCRHTGGLMNLVLWGNRSKLADPANRDVNATGRGLVLSGVRGVKLINVNASFAADSGIEMESYNYGTGAISTNNIEMLHPIARSNGSHGIYAPGGDNMITDPDCGNNGGIGLYLVTSGSVTGGAAWNNRSYGVYSQQGGDRGILTVTGMDAYDNDLNGFRAGGTNYNTAFRACSSRGNGRNASAAAADRANYLIGSGSRNWSLAACSSSSLDQTGAVTATYDAYIDNQFYSGSIDGFQPDLVNPTAGGIFISNPDNIISHGGATGMAHPGMKLTGTLDLANHIEKGVAQQRFQIWALVTAVAGAITPGNNSKVYLNEASPSITDITFSSDGLPVLEVRNIHATAAVFRHNTAKLRLIGQQDVTLNTNESITFTYVSGSVWQQSGGKVGSTVSKDLGEFTWAALTALTGVAAGSTATVNDLPIAGKRSRWYYHTGLAQWVQFEVYDQTYTWATKPDPTQYTGRRIRISDYGLANVGISVVSDGTRWIPDGPQLLGRSSDPSMTTTSTAEATLATVAVPGGLLGIYGSLRSETIWQFPNNANSKTMRNKYGGTTFKTVTVTTTANLSEYLRIKNKGVGNAQVANSATPGSANTTALSTGGVDSSVNQNFTYTAFVGVNTDTIALLSYELWALP